MTTGMTNAAPAGGGGGGETWLEHASTDWSDLIEYSNWKFTMLKTVRFMVINKSYNNPSMWTDVTIPKGTQLSSFKIPFTGNVPTTAAQFGSYFELYNSDIAGSTVRLKQCSFITDGSSITLSESSYNSWNKTNIIVKYLDD